MIEATAYFVVAEALTNVSKHARATTPRSRRASKATRSNSPCVTTASAARRPPEAVSWDCATGSPSSTATWVSAAQAQAASAVLRASPPR
jgi:hypothetical protein